jgi:CDP-diglyceride synthetase
MCLPVSLALVLLCCISAAFAQNSDNSTNTNDEDDGSSYSTSSAIFLLFFLGLLVPLSYLIVGIRVMIRVLPCDIAAYCCGYHIHPEELLVGEPFFFRDGNRARVRGPLHHGTLPDAKHVRR